MRYLGVGRSIIGYSFTIGGLLVIWKSTLHKSGIIVDGGIIYVNDGGGDDKKNIWLKGLISDLAFLHFDLKISHHFL